MWFTDCIGARGSSASRVSRPTLSIKETRRSSDVTWRLLSFDFSTLVEQPGSTPHGWSKMGIECMSSIPCRHRSRAFAIFVLQRRSLHPSDRVRATPPCVGCGPSIASDQRRRRHDERQNGGPDMLLRSRVAALAVIVTTAVAALGVQSGAALASAASPTVTPADGVPTPGAGAPSGTTFDLASVGYTGVGVLPRRHCALLSQRGGPAVHCATACGRSSRTRHRRPAFKTRIQVYRPIDPAAFRRHRHHRVAQRHESVGLRRRLDPRAQRDDPRGLRSTSAPRCRRSA